MSNEIAAIIEKIENKISDKKAKIATETDAAAVAVLYVKIAAYEEILEDISEVEPKGVTMTIKYNVIDQYNFENVVPDANSDNIVERVVSAIYQEIRTAEYANLSVTGNGSLMVDNYKVSSPDHKIKVVVKSHDGNTLGRVQQTFKNADSITTEDIRRLIRTAVKRHENKCRMLVSAA